MIYHNCIDNLWLISAAENSGMGEGAQDPIFWLDSHPTFKMYVHENEIDRSKILYSAKGVMLAKSVRAWFLEHHKNQPGVAKIINDFDKKLHFDIKPIVISKSSRVDTVVMFSLFDILMDFVSKRSKGSDDKLHRKKLRTIGNNKNRHGSSVQIAIERTPSAGSSEAADSSSGLSLDMNNPTQLNKVKEFVSATLEKDQSVILGIIAATTDAVKKDLGLRPSLFNGGKSGIIKKMVSQKRRAPWK